jgi:hypothetical protein
MRTTLKTVIEMIVRRQLNETYSITYVGQLLGKCYIELNRINEEEGEVTDEELDTHERLNDEIEKLKKYLVTEYGEDIMEKVDSATMTLSSGVVDRKSYEKVLDTLKNLEREVGPIDHSIRDPNPKEKLNTSDPAQWDTTKVEKIKTKGTSR